MGNIRIIPAEKQEHYSDATALILVYVKWLSIDLSFQNFDQEMADLPKMYNVQDGGLFIAYEEDQPVGVVGLRRLSATEAEVKRMFVKEEVRGKGIGKMLLQTCIASARTMNYKLIRLDTGSSMKAAVGLYTAHGFKEIPAYRFNPHEGAKYFELVL